MCGIAGYINISEKKADSQVLEDMLNTIVHRGPDSKGSIVEGTAAIGMRRLKIIDIETGEQPIFNETSDIAIVFNGEIYNFIELREELINKGHLFYTNSDTEVIIHLYEEDGIDFIDKLNGMFSFCIWDKRNDLFLFARDRFGKKPLHYSYINDTFIFGSEIKSLLEHPNVKRRISKASIQKYFLYGYIPAPDTIFSDIYKIMPGEYLIFYKKDGKIEKRYYWKPRFIQEKGIFNDLVKKTETLLSSSIERRLISDVPLGVFLSGGVDSSLIVALMSKYVDPKNIKTYSIGFREEAFDESTYSTKVAEIFHTDHHLKVFSANECLDAINEIYEFLDEPLADPSIIPTYLLSKFAKEDITVALGGDGGDELFGGYPKYYVHNYLRYYEILPLFTQKIIQKIIGLIPTSPDNRFLNYKIKRMFLGLKYPPVIRNQIWVGPFEIDELKKLLLKDYFVNSELFKDIELHQSMFDCNTSDVLSNMLYLDIRLMLQDMYLVKVDRASMATSLEVRCPFLDKELSEFVFTIPSSYKVKGFKTKYMLKKIAEKHLPNEIVYRGKKGFGLPIAKWLRGELRETLCYYLSKDFIEDQGIFNFDFVNNLLDTHLQEREDKSTQLWSLLIFQRWYENLFVDIGKVT
ncbi:MAG: asparagine synthase (glutamine-hydrolyzing) [Halobacteriota archaeon]|nr:asparagine synthase (glutamine-hydrolyzing) [Halobacteriota archaeon]